MKYLYDNRMNIIEAKKDEERDRPIAIISLFVLMGVMLILVMCF